MSKIEAYLTAWISFLLVAAFAGWLSAVIFSGKQCVEESFFEQDNVTTTTSRIRPIYRF